jgi:hypothetical protein
MFSKTFLKLLPYIIIVGLCCVVYFGFVHLTDKIEDLTTQNNILQAENSEVTNNYNTLQNMYSISMKQVEDLQRQQNESLKYVTDLKLKLLDIDLRKEYDKDSEKLLNAINDYEKCMALNFKDPYKYCYVE